jgi:hypothetical protein
MKKLRGCFGVFLIFFLGFLLGAIITYGSIYAKVWKLIESGPDEVAEFTVQRMNDELKLDSVQKREFQRIVDQTRLKLRAIRYRDQPETDAIVEESSNELRAILDPKQQKKFEDLMKRFRGRWRTEAPEATDAATPAPAPVTEPSKAAATPAPAATPLPEPAATPVPPAPAPSPPPTEAPAAPQ